MQSLNLFQWLGSLLNNQRLCVKLDKTDVTILKYQHHHSIKMIKRRFIDLPVFNFQAVSVADLKEIIMELKTDKAVSGEIPVKLLKDFDFSFHALTNSLMNPFKMEHSPIVLKKLTLLQCINPKIHLKKQITDL